MGGLSVTTYICWLEPYDQTETPVIGCEVRLKREDAILAQRRIAARLCPGFVYATDENALEDFVHARWASVVGVPDAP